jgi:hypothetical protein
MVAVGTWWRTIRHLRLRQLAGRATFRVFVPSPDTRPAPVRRRLGRQWRPAARREPSLLGPTRFRFLNVERDIADTRWNPAGVDRLWLYNLHYFDDLNALGAEARGDAHKALLTDWINTNIPAVGAGWEPYPVSLRVVNWIKWFLSGANAEPQWLHSLAVQLRWLRRRLEHHLLGNHLLANAKALIFGGVFFEGSEAEEWLRCGAALIAKELDEQVLADGGHFELSPMYHALAVEDVLDLTNLFDAAGQTVDSFGRRRAALRSRAAAMLQWLRCMTHPGGQVGLFNDCADGVAPTLAELEEYAARLGVAADRWRGPGIRHFADSGYVRVARGGMTAILDVARVGPDYLPAHAHADTLSFELSLGATRVIANGGTSCYGSTPRRHYERGTSAHTTVQVDGCDSSEVWSSFRVGRRAHPRNLEISGWRVTCAHDGYRFLKDAPVHKRSWSFGDGNVAIDDDVIPPTCAYARYFVPVGLQLQDVDGRSWRVVRGATTLLELTIETGHGTLERCSQAQRFGVVEDVDCLLVRLVDGRARTTLRFTD